MSSGIGILDILHPKLMGRKVRCFHLSLELRLTVDSLHIKEGLKSDTTTHPLDAPINFDPRSFHNLQVTISYVLPPQECEKGIAISVTQPEFRQVERIARDIPSSTR